MRRAKGETPSHNPPRASRALPVICGSQIVDTYRIIRCCDDIQYIFQRWREPKWRPLSYHVEYDSLVKRWARQVTHMIYPAQISSKLSLKRGFTHLACSLSPPSWH